MSKDVSVQMVIDVIHHTVSVIQLELTIVVNVRAIRSIVGDGFRKNQIRLDCSMKQNL